MPGALDHPTERLGAVQGAGSIAWWQGDIDACRALYEAALEQARALGSPILIAAALYDLGFAQLSSGGSLQEAALGLFVEAKGLYTGAADPLGVARAMWGEVNAKIAASAFADAYELGADVARRFRDLGQRFDLAWALHDVGVAAIHLERLPEAHAALAEALAILSESGDTSGLPLLLGDFADLAVAEGDRGRAMRLRGAAAAIQDLTGAALESATRGYNARYEIEPDLEDLSALEQAFQDGRAMTKEQATAYAVDAPEQGRESP
jgi:tetratricopeptide (TPR) repeat protein